MDSDPTLLARAVEERLDAADEALLEDADPEEPAYCGCRACEVSLMLRVVSEELRTSGFPDAAEALLS